MADNNDIDASVKAFTELNTKEEMKAHLKKVNEENGLSRRNKLKITGSRAVLERYYREYLEGGTATAEVRRSRRAFVQFLTKTAYESLGQEERGRTVEARCVVRRTDLDHGYTSRSQRVS
jgi:hypothetical protein